MRPVSTAAVGPVHDSPLGAGLGLRGPALEGCGPSGLRGGRRPLPTGGLHLQDSVLSWALRYGSGLSQVFQWLHLLSWILCVSTRRHKARRFGWNVCNGRILVFDKESVFHVGSDRRRPREGEQRVAVGRWRGRRLLAGSGGGGRGTELRRRLRLLLRQPLEQLLLPGARLLLPPQLLLLQDLFSQALLLLYLQTVQPRFFIFIRKLKPETQVLHSGVRGELQFQSVSTNLRKGTF